MPALILVVSTTFLFDILFIPEAWLSSSITRTGLLAYFGLSNIGLALGSNNYFSPSAAMNPFTHTWSLGVEEQFYLLFPFIMFWRQSARKGQSRDRATIRIVAALSALSFAVAGALTYINHSYAFYLLPGRFWELGLGMLLCLTIHQWRDRLASAAPLVRLSISVASLAFIASSFAMKESALFPFPLAWLPVLGTLGVIAVVTASPHDRVSRILAAGPVVTIGKLSYSLYLWHWPVVVGLRWTTGLESLSQQALALVLTIILSWLSFHYVESPLRHRTFAERAPRLRPIGLVLACTSVCAVVAYGAEQLKPHFTLSVTKNQSDWLASGERPPIIAYEHCDVAVSVVSIADGMRMTWMPSTCAKTVGRSRVIALGDSHNLMFMQNYRQLAADLGVEVSMYWKAECPYIPLHKPQSIFNHCTDFFNAALPEIVSGLKRHDVVFLQSLRLPRLSEQYQFFDPNNVMKLAWLPRQAAVADAAHHIEQFTRRGARVVVTAPFPLMSAPSFRCSDWFNRSNPICERGMDTPRAYLETLRRPTLVALESLRATNPSLTIWDEFNNLCPGTVCRSSDGPHPLYFDGDHLSGYGVAKTYPSFRNVILDAFAATNGSQTTSASKRPLN